MSSILGNKSKFIWIFLGVALLRLVIGVEILNQSEEKPKQIVTRSSKFSRA